MRYVMSIASGRRLVFRPAFPFASLIIIVMGFSSGTLPAAVAYAAQPVGPPSPLPAFYLIETWESMTRQAANSDNTTVDPVVTAVDRLCRFYDMTLDPRSPMLADPSPLEWPRVFADEAVNPRRLQTYIEALMAKNGLKFRELVTLENGDAADSMMRAISVGDPVLLNVPEAAIVYGYDRREPDAWWWIQRPQKTEIMYESERVQSLMYWADDPASNLAWAVTGTDSTWTFQSSGDRKAAYDWLRTVLASVQDDPAHGIKPYPLSLRALRDRVTTSVEAPKLAEPVNQSDPLGVRRARTARLHLIELLEWLSQMPTDTLETEPLRLALYYYHNAVQSLDQLDTLLYDAQSGPVSPSTCQANWRYDVRKGEIVRRIDELLEWEKQAAGEIGEAVSVVTPPVVKKKRK